MANWKASLVLGTEEKNMWELLLLILVERKVDYQYIPGWNFKVCFNYNSNEKALLGACLI